MIQIASVSMIFAISSAQGDTSSVDGDTLSVAKRSMYTLSPSQSDQEALVEKRVSIAAERSQMDIEREFWISEVERAEEVNRHHIWVAEKAKRDLQVCQAELVQLWQENHKLQNVKGELKVCHEELTQLWRESQKLPSSTM